MAELKKLEAHLANERTLLAYVRTACAVLVLAVAMLKFFQERWVMAVGVTTLAAGVGIALLGVYRYAQERRRIGRHAPEDAADLSL